MQRKAMGIALRFYNYTLNLYDLICWNHSQMSVAIKPLIWISFNCMIDRTYWPHYAIVYKTFVILSQNN